jgi:hypothetical protein
MSGLKNWYKLGLAIAAVLGAAYFIIFHWSRFVQDFYPLDASRVAPNIVASIVQYAILLVAGYLLYPPIRRAVNRYVAGHVKDIKTHISAENKAIHEKLDRHEKLQHHIILNSRSIPNEVPGVDAKHQPQK